MQGYSFEDGLAVLVVPPMPPVCLIIGIPAHGEVACDFSPDEFPLFIVYSLHSETLVLRPGDSLVALTPGEGDLEALCRESQSRHGGWNTRALGDAVNTLCVHGVVWSSSKAPEALLLPRAA